MPKPTTLIKWLLIASVYFYVLRVAVPWLVSQPSDLTVFLGFGLLFVFIIVLPYTFAYRLIKK